MLIRNTAKIIIILMILIISGCKEAYRGQLTVHHTMEFTHTEGKRVTLSPGTYQTTLRFSEDTSVLELKITGDQKQNQTLNLSGSNNVRIPETGSFSFGVTESGQQYEISGDRSVKETKTETTTGFEFCTERRMFTDCSGAPKGKCRRIWRESEGKRPIKYHFDIKHYGLSIHLTEPDTGRLLAGYEGKIEHRWKIVTFRGPCMATRFRF